MQGLPVLELFNFKQLSQPKSTVCYYWINTSSVHKGYGLGQGAGVYLGSRGEWCSVSSRAARTMERPCLKTHSQSGLECVHIAIYFGFLCKTLFYAFSFNCLSVYLFCVCVCMQAQVYSHRCHSTWVGRSVHGERFLLYYVDPGTWTQVSRLWGKCLYQLSRLSSPERPPPPIFWRALCWWSHWESLGCILLH